MKKKKEGKRKIEKCEHQLSTHEALLKCSRHSRVAIIEMTSVNQTVVCLNRYSNYCRFSTEKYGKLVLLNKILFFYDFDFVPSDFVQQVSKG